MLQTSLYSTWSLLLTPLQYLIQQYFKLLLLQSVVPQNTSVFISHLNCNIFKQKYNQQNATFFSVCFKQRWMTGILVTKIRVNSSQLTHWQNWTKKWVCLICLFFYYFFKNSFNFQCGKEFILAKYKFIIFFLYKTCHLQSLR